jgi:hypothetical protein
VRAAIAALACLALATGVSAAAGPTLPSAFERAAASGDQLPASFQDWGEALGEGRPYQSRRIATLNGTKRVWTLYIFKQQKKRIIFKRKRIIRQGKPSLHVCMFLFTQDRRDAQDGGGGGGCSPADKFFGAGRDINASSSRVIAGVASDRVARVAIVGSLGRVHRVPLSPDNGFIFNCRAYNGCACVVSRIQAFDQSGNRIEDQDWRSSARNCRRR